jgi:hypothetical protein
VTLAKLYGAAVLCPETQLISHHSFFPEEVETMMRDARWYSRFYSAMIAGFEAYGSAQVGMAPSSMQTGEADAEIEERAAQRVAGKVTCNQHVAKTQKEFIFSGRTRFDKNPADVAWKHA